MKKFIVRGFRLIGIDRAIAYTVAGRGWSVLAGPITFACLATFLSPEEQGFYYTFGSVLGLQIFIELGLSWVIVQFASHERAALEWTDHGTLQGDAHAKQRLSALFRATSIWYTAAAVIMVAALLPGGYLFLSKYDVTAGRVAWQIPWMLVVLVSAGNLLTTPYFAVLEGCGLIGKVALLQMWQNVMGSLTLWLALSQHCRLYTGPINAILGLAAGVCWLWFTKRNFFTDLRASGGQGHTRAMWGEVWPLQWRFALSWMSNYLVFQLFNPVLFAFQGPVAAGQMGMSMNMTMAIMNIAIAWVTTKAAPFGSLIARRHFAELDRLFFGSLWRSSVLAILGGSVFWVGVIYLRSIHHPWGQRLLDPITLGLLIGTGLLQHIVGAEGVYLRAHKKEPFLGISIFSAALMAFSTYFIGKQYGARGMMIGYFLVVLTIGLGMGTYIFITKRREWHSETVALQPPPAAAESI